MRLMNAQCSILSTSLTDHRSDSAQAMTGLTGIKVVAMTQRTDDPIIYTEQSLLESFEGACQLASSHGLSRLTHAFALVASHHQHLSARFECHYSRSIPAKMLIGSKRHSNAHLLVTLSDGRSDIGITHHFPNLTFTLQKSSATIKCRQCSVILHLRRDKITEQPSMDGLGDSIALGPELDMLTHMVSAIVAELSDSLTFDSLEAIPRLLADSTLKLLQLPGTTRLWKVDVIAGFNQESGQFRELTAAKYLLDLDDSSSTRTGQRTDDATAANGPLDVGSTHVEAPPSDLDISEDRDVAASPASAVQLAGQLAGQLASTPDLDSLSIPVAGYEHLSFAGLSRVAGYFTEELEHPPM